MDKGIRIIDNEGVENLMNAVVMQAVKDYRSALRRYHTTRDKVKKWRARCEAEEGELFFKEYMGAYCTIDGNKVISKIRDEVRRELSEKGILMEELKHDSKGII